MKTHKKLIQIECSAYLDPPIAGRLFESVGFEVKWDRWGILTSPDVFLEKYPAWFESEKPDVIVFVLGTAFYIEPPTPEPAEWIEACQRIRNNPDLQHTKIAGFLGPQANVQHQVWQKRYDFYSLDPIRAIEHACAIKRLVGEEVTGLEGVIFFLLYAGKWELQPHLQNPRGSRDEFRPDAEGQFDARSRKTRLLTLDSQCKHIWGESIRTGMPTYIVFVIKSPEQWEAEGLNDQETRRIVSLAAHVSSGSQLLLGVNNALLATSPSTIARVVQQARRAGGWQLFINEHLWFEGVCLPDRFESIVYEGIEFNYSYNPFVL